MRHSVRHLVVAAALLAAALGGCVTVDPLDDPRIESEVKARLVAQKDANLTRLGVLSRDGTVYLSGTVPTTEQRAQAAVVANGVRGVKKVVNTIEVRGAP